MATILLTGATGFIGRHVLALLLERGDTVVSFGRSRPEVSAEYQTRHLHIEGDLATGEGLARVPWAKIDQVIHLAAAGVKASRRQWPEALAVNVVGTQRLLEVLRSASLRPRVFVARTFYEDLVSEAPALLENPYIATKHAATQLARLFAREYAGGVVFGNFFQVYGPGDDSANVLSYAAREFKAGRAPVFGSGKGLRDWIYVTDAAAAVLASLRQFTGSGGHSFDIGTGEMSSIRAMVEALHRLCPAAPNPVFDPTRDGPDADLAMCAKMPPTAWRPGIEPEQGLLQLKITL